MVIPCSFDSIAAVTDMTVGMRYSHPIKMHTMGVVGREIKTKEQEEGKVLIFNIT